MEKESKITNEDLARMIKNDVVDKMVTKEDLRTLEKKVDDIDKNVKEINMKIHDIEESTSRHTGRIGKLEEAVFEVFS